MKVTILTSIYKGGQFIDGFLSNITQQTIFDQCQLFILDANSNQHEYNTIYKYQQKHENILYKRTDSTIGLYAAWNLMIKESSSDYITNANVDDKLLPESIEKHVYELDHNNDVDVVYCNNYQTTNYNCDSIENLPIVRGIRPCTIGNMLRRNLPHNHPVWRRSLHEKIGMFNEGLCIAGDWEFWLRCVIDGVKMHFIREPLGIYYLNPCGLSTNTNSRHALREWKMVRRHFTRILDSRGKEN